MSENEKTMNNLADLGPGVGSKVEKIKFESNYLRGQLAEELAEGTTHFSEPQVQLLKFSGTYQQEDRDARHVRRTSGGDKAYQFMVRSRIPGGVLTAEQYLVEDDARPLRTDDMLLALGGIRPIAQVKAAEVEDLRRWAREALAIDAHGGATIGQEGPGLALEL